METAELLEQTCEANANKIRSRIRAATEAAFKDARSISNTMDGCGIGVGELARMPIQQKMELTKRDLRRSKRLTLDNREDAKAFSIRFYFFKKQF